MSQKVHYEPSFEAGLTCKVKMTVPVLASDPTGGDLVEGRVWFNSTDNLFKYYDGTSVISLGAAAGLDAEGVADIVGAMVTGNTETGISVAYQDGDNTLDFALDDEYVTDLVGAMVTDTATINFTYTDGSNQITAAVLDSPKLEGNTLAQVQSAIIAAIVDSAPGTLDTLNELAAALGDDPNFATSITTLINARARVFTATLTGGSLTETKAHNFNTRNWVACVYNQASTYDEESYLIQHGPTANDVTVVSEAANIVAGRLLVVIAQGT